MTRQEKAVIYFLIGMLALGLAVKFYKSRTGRVNLKVARSTPMAPDADIDRIIKEKGLVKINTATTEDLARLPGIGATLAQRIIDYRAKNGSFSTKEDLKKVSGIGEKKYQAVKDYITVE
jgi:comEA protein